MFRSNFSGFKFSTILFHGLLLEKILLRLTEVQTFKNAYKDSIGETFSYPIALVTEFPQLFPKKFS